MTQGSVSFKEMTAVLGNGGTYTTPDTTSQVLKMMPTGSLRAGSLLVLSTRLSDFVNFLFGLD